MFHAEWPRGLAMNTVYLETTNEFGKNYDSEVWMKDIWPTWIGFGPIEYRVGFWTKFGQHLRFVTGSQGRISTKYVIYLEPTPTLSVGIS